MEVLQCFRRMIMARITPKEELDPVPIHIPGLGKPLTLQEEMKRFIREELSRAVVADDSAGSFTEEDDFSEDDGDADLLTQYTVTELFPESNDYDLEPSKEDKSQVVSETGEEAPEPGAESSPASQPQPKAAEST